jgi:hypothetical protein
MKTFTIADIDMAASLMETLPSWQPFWHKSSIYRIFGDVREDGTLNQRLARPFFSAA